MYEGRTRGERENNRKSFVSKRGKEAAKGERER
jgi:hypothetical protein